MNPPIFPATSNKVTTYRLCSINLLESWIDISNRKGSSYSAFNFLEPDALDESDSVDDSDVAVDDSDVAVFESDYPFEIDSELSS